MDYPAIRNEHPASVQVLPPRNGEIVFIGDKKYKIISWTAPTLDEARPQLRGGTVPASFGGTVIVVPVK